MIPEGSYKARAEDADLSETNAGNPQVAVLLRLISGGPAVEQQLITWYGSFTEKAIDRTLESLRYLGWKGDDLSNLQGVGTSEVTVVIEHGEDPEGKLRARVKWINSGGGLAVKKRMDAGGAKAFAEKMRGYVMWHNQRQKGGQPAGGGSAPAPASSSKAAPTAPETDDIPF